MSNNGAKKVIVGLSGGVDSSVSAALLLREGYEVVGAFMKNWSEHDGGQTCSWRQDYADAQAVAEHLGIPLLFFDFEEEYRSQVYAYMLAEYEAGRTPNPDVLCNEKVKFGPFLQRALDEGADLVATGHYARVNAPSPRDRREIRKGSPQSDAPSPRDRREWGEGWGGGYQLIAGQDPNKDQSYFLHRLTPAQLQHVIFPVGELQKTEVRVLAREFGLPVANKKDSVGICFVGEKNMPEFLAQGIAGRPGPIVSTEGHVVGRHRGIAPFTIGQRHGMNIGDGQPYFVVDKDMPRNTLVVARGEDPAELYSKEINIEQPHWINGQPELPLRCRARIRYRQPLQDCDVQVDGRVIFDEPQRAVTPGQFAVFYDSDICLGGAVIS